MCRELLIGYSRPEQNTILCRYPSTVQMNQAFSCYQTSAVLFATPLQKKNPFGINASQRLFFLFQYSSFFFLASQLNLPQIWTQETSSMMYSSHIAEKTSPGSTRSSYLYLIITKSNIAWISSTLNLAKRFYKAWWKASIRAAKFQQSGRPITLLVNIANKNWTMPYSGVLKKVTQQ